MCMCLCFNLNSKQPHPKMKPSDLTLQRFHPPLTLPVPTFVPCDWDDVPGRGRHTEDVSTLDFPLGFHIVLEGAVDPG